MNSNQNAISNANNCAVCNFCRAITVLTVMSYPQRFSDLFRLTGLLLIGLNLLCTPAFAASDNSLRTDAASIQPQHTYNESDATINQQNFKSQLAKLRGSSEVTGEYHQSYYLLNQLNTGLPSLNPPPNLSTPLATLEFFKLATDNQHYKLAAQALNMNLFNPDIQRARGDELAERLDFLLAKKDLYDFNQLPDRPDGLIEPSIGSNSDIDGSVRRSIQLGHIKYLSYRIPIYIERVKVEGADPVWVFSSQTVGHIDKLYEQYKPATFERYLPDFLLFRPLNIAIWEYIALSLFFLLTIALGWAISKGAGKLMSKYAQDENKRATLSLKSTTDLINKLIVPLTITISLALVFTLVSGGFPYLDDIATDTRPIIWVALVISAIWLGVRLINFFADRYQDLQIDGLGQQQYDEYRIRITYLSVFRRVFIFVMIIGSVWIGLSEFVNIEGLGKTLLTSAGILSIVIGIAAQPTLGNIVAGIQIAITQPIRIGDTIMYDGNWSTVEDLGYTYATIKTWDERRLFVPMRYFVTETVENWSHPDPHQTRTIYLLTDYGIAVDEVRKKFVEVVKNNSYWDGQTEPTLQVLSTKRDTLQLYGTIAADNPDDAWLLECQVREQMVTYLSDKQQHYLPAERIVLINKDADS